MGKVLFSMFRPIPPGTSSWLAKANRMKTARAACTPQLENSSPVYINGQAPLALTMRWARSLMVSAGTPVIVSATSGLKCWV